MPDVERTPNFKGVEIIPNYKSMFDIFLRDFSIHASNLNSLDYESHEKVQNVLASLNVALSVITTTDDLETLRNALVKATENSGINLRLKEPDYIS